MDLVKLNCPTCNINNCLTKIPALYTRELGESGPQMVECLSCGLNYLDSTYKNLKSFYDRDGQRSFVESYIHDYEEKSRGDARERVSKIKHIIFDKKVLDIGCGFGHFLEESSQYTRQSCGLELSASRAEACQSKNLEVTCGKINTLKKEYDVITLFHVLEHFDNTLEYLLQINKLLKNDGRLVIEIPNLDDLLVRLPEYKRFYCQTAHLSYFSKKTIYFLLDKCGFIVEKNISLQRYSLGNHLFWWIHKKPGSYRLGWLDAVYNWLIKHTQYHDTMFLICKKRGAVL